MAEFDVENKKTEKILITKAQNLDNRGGRVLYLNAALLSVYGWQLSIPVLIGVAVGRLLDKHVPSAIFSWTLNFIFIGFVVGIINANRWLHKEGKTKSKDKQ